MGLIDYRAKLLDRAERSNPPWQKAEKLRHKSEQLREHSRQMIAKLKQREPIRHA